MASSVNFGTQSYFGFDPRNIPGCVTWLDATDRSTVTFSSGSNVSAWKEKSSNVSFTATNSPVWISNGINGYPAMYAQTRATGQYFNGTGSITGTTLSVFAVATTTLTLPNAVGDQRLVSLAATGVADYNSASYAIGLFNQSASSTIQTYRNSVGLGSNTIVINTPFLASAIYDGTNGSLYFNGTLGTGSGASTGSFSISRIGIGNQANPSGETWQGYIGEVLIYSTALTSDQRQQVEGYLAWKWGLNGSLSSISPYKLICPLARSFRPPDVGPMLFWWDSSVYSSISVSAGTVGAGGTVSSWNDRINNVALTVPAGLVGPVSTSNGVSFTNVSATVTNAVTQCLHFSNVSSPWTLSQNTTVLVASAPNRFDTFRASFGMIAPIAFNVNPSYYLITQMGASEGNTVGAYNGSTTWLSLQQAAAVSTTAGAGRVDTLLSAPSNFAWTNGTENTYSINNISRGAVVSGTGTLTGMVIGGTSTILGNRAFDGLIYEILVFNTNLPTWAIRQLEGYLAWKWKFPRNLVSTHPYYNIPVSVPRPPASSPLPYSGTNAQSFVAKYNSNGVLQWNASTGGLDSQIAAVTTDSSGSVYVIGDYSTSNLTINSSDGTIFNTSLTFSGYDNFVAKYDTNGTVLWIARIGGTGQEISASITTDTSGNVYALGSFNSSPLTIYNADGTTFGTRALIGSRSVYLIKYNTSGAVQWVARIGGASTNIGFNVATDSAGNVCIAGYYTSATLTAYDGSTDVAFGTTLSNSGSNDVFVIKYNASGAVQWLTRAGGTGADFGYGIRTDSSGNVYVSGRFLSNPITFYNSNGTTFGTIALSGVSSGFLVKYDSTGTVQWTLKIGSAATQYVYSVSTDSAANVYIAGEYNNNPLTIYNSDGTSFGTTLAFSGGTDVFVAKYNTSGFAQWLAGVGGTSTEGCLSAVADSNGNVRIAGTYTSSTITVYNAGGTTFTTITNPNAQQHLFYVAYNTSGAAQWAVRAASSISELTARVAIDTGQNMITTGVFNGTPLTLYSQGQ